MTHVTIPIPALIPTGRGVSSTYPLYPVSFRMSIEEEQLVEQQARALNLSKSNFVRWCAVHVARALAGRSGEQDGHNVHRPSEDHTSD